MTLSRGRFRLVAVGLGVWAAVAWLRLVQVQVLQQEHWQREALRQQERLEPADPPRGDIRTRDGRLLAGSVQRTAVWANPGRIPKARWHSVAEALAPLTGIERDEILGRFEQRNRFFYLGKDYDPEIATAVARLDIRGVGTLPQDRRVYPHGTFAGPVVGFVNADLEGQAGIERSYQRTLAGTPGLYRLIRDGKRNPTRLELREEKAGRPGLSLILSLDSRVQALVEGELTRVLREVGAAGGAGVVMDPRTGEILALASLPAYDPGAVGQSPRDWWRNRAVEDALEPGSSFKPFMLAAAMSHGVLHPAEVIDCTGGGIQVAGAFIRDNAHFGHLPLRQMLAKSSNVGVIRVAHRLPPDAMAQTIRALGFGRPTGVELPAEAHGIFRPPAQWSALSRAGLAIGQELSVTALQMARAYSVIANGGNLVRPTLVLEARSPDGRIATQSRPEVEARVLPGPVTATLRDLLESAVADGTGRGAQVPGYRIAGKTGTAQRAIDGGYRGRHHAAWFAGFLPAHQPRVVLVLFVDQPRTAYWASEVAAPAAGRIAAQLVVLLGLPPSGGHIA